MTINTLLQLAVLAVMARHVAPRDFGLVGIVTVVMSFSLVVSQLGFGQALIRTVVLRIEDIRSAFALSVYTGLLLFLGIWQLAPYISAFFGEPGLDIILKVMSFALLFKAVSIVAEALLMREMQFRWIAIRETVSYVVAYGVVGVYMALSGYGLWALVCAYILQASIRSLLVLARSRHAVSLLPDLPSLKKLLSYGSGATTASLLNKAATHADNVIVGKLLGMEALGFYGRAYSIMSKPANLFGIAVQKVLFPAFSVAQNDRRRLLQAYLDGVALIAALVMPMAVLVWFYAAEIVVVLLGESWLSVVVVLKVFSLGLYFRLAYKSIAAMIRASGRVYALSAIQALYLISIILGAYIGVHFGLAGAAAGVVGGLGLHYFLMVSLGNIITGASIKAVISAHKAGIILSIFAATSALFMNFISDMLQHGPMVKLSSGIVVVTFAVVMIGISMPWVVDRRLARMIASFIGTQKGVTGKRLGTGGGK